MENKDKLIRKLGLKQGAIKILINSIYGAFGNKWFYFYNPDIAQSITLQGQDLIKFSIKAINHYFREKWHLDTELHKILGIDGMVINKVNEDAAIYTDTDSVYVQFGSALKSVEGLELTQDEYLEMCIKIDKHRMVEYFNTCFEKWSKLYNTDNRQTFKLELIGSNGFWIKKKNYALRVAYEPNPKQELYPIDDRYLLIKGLEPIKASYPIWARNHQTAFIEYLLEKGSDVDLEGILIPMIKTIREEFEDLHPNDVSQSFRIRTYDKYVDSEREGTLLKGATTYPKAVMHHNHLVLKNEVEGTYPRIRQGNKIQMYTCEPNEDGTDVFGYNPGIYPNSIAPPMNKDAQFFTLIVEPINRILGAFGVNKIDIYLKRAVTFKTTKSKNPLTEKQLYPFHVIDEVTLEHSEVPEKFWKIIENPGTDIPEELFDEYLQTITRYGLNSVILINKNLKPFKKRIAKKLGIELPEEVVEPKKKKEKKEEIDAS